MNLDDLPTVEVALAKRAKAIGLLAKFESHGFWVLPSQDEFDSDFVARIKADCAFELRKMVAELTALIAGLGVNEGVAAIATPHAETAPIVQIHTPSGPPSDVAFE